MPHFFGGERAKNRENIRSQLSDQLTSDLRDHGFIAMGGTIDSAIATLKTGPKSIHPFHWELEFPEVFAFDPAGEPTGGFDLIVGKQRENIGCTCISVDKSTDEEFVRFYFRI